jgi:serine/threonine protein phosphatase 1
MTTKMKMIGMMIMIGMMTTRPERILVIGDVHGALKAVKQCLVRSKYNQEKDRLIFLGDYTDGWSDNAKTIEFLHWFAECAVFKPIFIKGNHDEWVKKWLHTGVADPRWIELGGARTIKSYIKSGFVTQQRHRDFFENLQPYHVDSFKRGYVHAGFLSPKGLGHEICDAQYTWDKTLWKDSFRAHNTVAYERQRCFKHTELFIGHTPTCSHKYTYRAPELKSRQELLGKRIYEPMNRLNVWNLDTGAARDEGKLTIMDSTTKEYWQSDVVGTLYPEESLKI